MGSIQGATPGRPAEPVLAGGLIFRVASLARLAFAIRGVARCASLAHELSSRPHFVIPAEAGISNAAWAP